MYVPETYRTALILMLTSMVCWGSWPNFLKKLPEWRLEYFYLDYTLGFLITAVIYGISLGSGQSGESGFFDQLLQAGPREAVLAVLGGFIWNVGNILLLNSIMIVGLAVAFPIAAIPAIVLGIGASYWLHPVGNPLVLATSALLLLVAAQTTAAAYRRLGNVITEHRSKGIVTALISGLLIGFFPPLTHIRCPPFSRSAPSSRRWGLCPFSSNFLLSATEESSLGISMAELPGTSWGFSPAHCGAAEPYSTSFPRAWSASPSASELAVAPQ